jgi:hypothetical protein
VTPNDQKSAAGAALRGPEEHPGNEADYAAIEAAVMETARGRWFLSEFARRNRAADTELLLRILERIEQTLASGEFRAGPAAGEAAQVPPGEAVDTVTSPEADAQSSTVAIFPQEPDIADAATDPEPATAEAGGPDTDADRTAAEPPEEAGAVPELDAPPLQSGERTVRGLGIDLSDLSFEEKTALFS